nr:hypothetical protein [Parachlamydiaceae bacterium]
MKTRGIRILDKEKRVVIVELQDIFQEISNGDFLQWSILFFNGTGKLQNGKSILLFETEINKLQKGLLINWKELNDLAKQFYDVYDILIVGFKKPDMIARYENDQEMYESCDIVIEMIDSGYWEVFSNDEELI